MLHPTINKVMQLHKKAILHWHGTQNTERDRGGSGKGHAFLTFFCICIILRAILIIWPKLLQPWPAITGPFLVQKWLKNVAGIYACSINASNILQSFLHIPILPCVSKNAPTLASCIFNKHRLILLIFSKQHRHTFKNYMPIQLSLSLHFYLLYLLSNSSDGNDAKRNMFSLVHCWWLWKEPFVKGGSSERDVLVQQMFISDVLLLSHMHVTAFAIVQQLRRWVLWYACARVSKYGMVW